MTKDKISAIGTGILSLTALDGSSEVVNEVASALQTPDYNAILDAILKVVVSIITVWKLTRKDKPTVKESEASNGTY